MAIELDIEVGDIVLTGKFKNKRTKVKEIGTDDLGQPTINGKPILKLRIEKHLPKEKQSKETRESTMTEHSNKKTDFADELAGLFKEEKTLKEEWGPKGQAKLLGKMIRQLEQVKEELEDVYDDQNVRHKLIKKLDSIVSDLVKRHTELEPDSFKHFITLV